MDVSVLCIAVLSLQAAVIGYLNTFRVTVVVLAC